MCVLREFVVYVVSSQVYGWKYISFGKLAEIIYEERLLGLIFKRAHTLISSLTRRIYTFSPSLIRVGVRITNYFFSYLVITFAEFV